MDSLDSRQLLDQIERGDRGALNVLFARHRQRLERLLRLRCGSALLQRAEIDDLVQEAYMEAARQLSGYSYQGPDSFFRWLATIALNRMHNLRRQEQAEKRDPKRELRLAGPETVQKHGGVADTPLPGPGPRTLTSSQEELVRLEAGLNELSSTDREVILLARIEGLALQDVAERMGRTRNAVALLLSRALRKLKAHLRDGDQLNDSP